MRKVRLEPTAMTTDNLPRRLRETLARLLAGDTEKRAAERLGISRSTLHQYVTMRYRHFGVRSRCQLLIYCLRRSKTGPEPQLTDVHLSV
jgi:DNA-binding NarL/FixJ family response regulator